MNNSNGVTLNTGVKLSDTLNFSDGIITASGGILEMTGTSESFTNGQGDGKYVDGLFRRNVANNVTYTLPI
jgi:hypothetical protein